MMRTISLVATDELVDKLFLDRHSASNPVSRISGIASSQFDVDSANCKSKFASWLVDHVPTTRRDDDLSIVQVTLPLSEEDYQARDLGATLSQSRLRSLADMERLHDRIQGWLKLRKGHASVYGEELFRLRTIVFDWPVLGSRAADFIEDPAAYFDLCAGRIRSMNPVKVALWGGREPPESLQVCKG